MTAEFQQTPTLVAVLYDSSPAFDYEEGLWALLEDGTILGQASDDAAYFPALDSGDANGAEAATFPFAELEAPPPSEPIAVSSEAAGGD